MIRSWLTVGLMLLSFQAFSQQAATTLTPSSEHYIKDDLFVFMHAGPGRNYRILGSIEAGTPITVLQTDAENGFTEVSDDTQNRTGWVESDNLTTTMSRKEQVPQLSEQVETLRTELSSAQSENTRLKQQLSESRQQLAKITTQAEEQMRDITALNKQISNANKDEMMMWFTRGGLVAGAGIILGIVITYLPKKRRRNDTWM